MKKIAFFFLLVLFTGLYIPDIFALSAKEAGRILQAFKNQEKQMIFESDSPVLQQEDLGIISSYKKLGVFESIADSLQAKREYLQTQNEKLANRVVSLEAAIAELEEDITTLTDEINAINSQIIVTKDKIEENQKVLEETKKKIEESSQTIMDYMVYLYKKGEFVKTQGEMDNLKAILLSGQDIDELVNDMHFKSIIQITGQQLIQKHREYLSDLYKTQVTLQKNEKEYRVLRKESIVQKSMLDDKKASKERLLEATKGQEEIYKKYISEKLDAEQNIRVKQLRERIALNNTKKDLLGKYNCEFIDLGLAGSVIPTDISDECMGINKIIYAESRISGITVGNNPFDWPITPSMGLSAYFRDENYKKEVGAEHDAIDIITPQGTDIKAPMDGYVLYLQPPVNNGYAYIALKHSDGLVSVYGHISEVLVGQYDFVKRGEVFAKSGGEYGTKGAGVLTTGPHLHMAVYKDEEYVDPLNFLNLSFLSYDSLPERYEFKYLSDFKSKKGYEYKQTKNTKGVFRIEGDTEIERQKYLLSTYGVGDFRNWDIWVEESVAEGIDPTFTMCVGLAETTLGKYLKTSYNIGNVGNTDSGGTYEFSSAREGIRWMTKTFNNRFLGGYTKISDLSRYGNTNPDKPIYASSDYNWHNNVTKCMSYVKGFYIPDDYAFRLKDQSSN